MNKLTPKQRARVLACLVEGNSMRSTQRMTGFAKKTVERILGEAGEHCSKLLDDRQVCELCDRRINEGERGEHPNFTAHACCLTELAAENEARMSAYRAWRNS